MMIAFESREQVVDWLTAQARERALHDAMELVQRDGLTKAQLRELLPGLLQEAIAWRDEILRNIDSMAMDMNATNVPEHQRSN